MANESGVAQDPYGGDDADSRDEPARKARARCWKRGLHDECVRSQTGAVIVALGAVLVMLPATWPHAHPDWVPPAMLESALGLMAWIFLLITVSRRIEARRVAKVISASSVAGKASGGRDPLRSQLLAWVVVALPGILFPLALYLLGARPQWGPKGSAIVDASPDPQGNVKVFVFSVASLIVAMALITWLLSWRTIRDADKAVATVEGTVVPSTLDGMHKDKAVATEEGTPPNPVFDRKPVARRVGDDDPPRQLQGLTIACSGGGVRAAAFSLGGINAVQARGSDLDDQVLGLSSIVAVSGGSYMAAAFALTCTYDDEGDPLVKEGGKDQGKPLHLKDVYVPGTPELTHIRRNSRYLYEPWWRTTATVLQLVAGAAVNVLVAVAALRFGAWFLGWLLPELGLLRPPFADPESEGPGWAGVDWLLKVGPWALPAAGVVLALAVQLYRRSRRDNGDGDTPSQPTWAMAMARSAQATLVGAALFVLVPGLIMGLGQLAYANAPTPAVANAIVALGFTREKDCASALTESAASTWETVVDQRRLSAQDTSGPYGACGKTGTLRATAQDVVSPVGTTPALSGDQLQLISKQAGDTSKRGVFGQLTGVLTVLASALALIRQGTTKVPLGDSKTLAAVRRWFMVRLPLMAVVTLALLLLLQWTYQISINNASRAEIGSWVLVLLAISLSMLDPNLTSMHEAYRERLSSAFAVGRGVEGGAAALPYKRCYKLSELPDRPELVICTTANINDQQVVPTRRFGVPMTFGRNEVRLEVADTDAAAGHLRTTDAENDGDSPTLSVMGAVAMSGAAVSPLMGRESAAGGPFRLLLTLFNVRLGVWVRNPRWPQSPDRSPWSLIVWRPRLAMLFGEAAGATRVDSRWLYVTDGGHLDNTGLVEAARRAPDRVLVLDAGNDVAGSWEDLGSAVSVVRADLGIDLVVKDEDPDGTWILLAGEKPAARGGGILRVLSVKAALPTSDEGQAALPKDVMSFHKTHPSFPRASTGRQDFGDLEFEAYRRLGQYSVDRALAAVDAP